VTIREIRGFSYVKIIVVRMDNSYDVAMTEEMQKDGTGCLIS